jgi:hypothetical protein
MAINQRRHYVTTQQEKRNDRRHAQIAVKTNPDM